MKKVLLFICALFFLQLFSQAQKITGTLTGTLQDSASGTPLNDATVSVIRAQDSSLLSFTLSSSSGYFEIKNLAADRYILLVSYGGFQTLHKPFAVTAERPAISMGIVYLNRSYKTLDEVIVKDETPIKVKGDTLAFNANAFKTKPNATVEDLLKKLPGMQVEKDGTVKAQGEQVQKVYVDGKEFFGNDPKIATKNLSADMIDEVELYDDMSEQAKFNKIDDGSRTKAINLKLKKEKKRGVFGQVGAGYGTNNRYSANVRTNFFKGAKQVGVFANSNNANKVGFSTTDMLGIGGGNFGGFGGGMVISKSSGGGSSIGLGSNGITTSSAAGINYSDVWNKFFDINGNYNFNNTSTSNLRKSYRQSFLGNTTLLDDRNTTSNNNSNVSRANFRITYTINERNSLVYSPSISFQNTSYNALDSVTSFLAKGGDTSKVNQSKTINTNKGNGVNWTNNLLWRKKFAKAGRTLSANFSNTYGRNNVDGFNSSLSTDYRDGVKVKDSVLNQQSKRISQTNNYGISLSYTEPIGRDKIWETNYSYNTNNNTSDKTTNDFNGTSGKYEILNDLLSNEFENSNTANRLGTNFRVIKKKYNYQLGIAAQKTSLKSNNISKASYIKQNYTNLFPTASFVYQFARSKSLRFNYRGRTNQPNSTQLQPIVDVSDPRNIRQGNPALNQEFINNFTLNYNSFNITKFKNLFAYVTFSNTYNKIVNSSQVIDSFGRQLIKPVNTSGVYSVNGNFNYGFPINGFKGGNINTTSRLNYNRDASFVRSSKAYTKNLSLGQDVRVNYNYKDKLDLGITGSINYTSARNTIQLQQNNAYYTHVYSFDATYTLPKNFILSSDFDYTANRGRTAGYNEDYAMWNASFAKQVLKNKKGEVKVSVFDILNQNISLSRNVTDNYVEDVQTKVLQRFFMLSFVYNINRMGGKNMPAQNRTIRNVIIQ